MSQTRGNPWAGEVTLTLNGEVRVMKLTLGALAELEAGLGADSLIDLVTRFESGGFSTRDVIAVLVAGLHGGGLARGEIDLARADIAGGPVAAAQAAGQLILRAFALPEAGA